MGSVFKAGPVEIRRQATGMSPELIGRLSQGELNLRLREMDRLFKLAGSPQPDIVAYSIDRKAKVRDALPYPEFVAKLESYHRQLDALPGTGIEALETRQGLWALIVELKKKNVYPEGVERTLSGSGRK